MPLIPNSFNGLVSAVRTMAEDDSQEFENFIPTAIFLAEERLVKSIDKEGLKATTTVTATPGNSLLTKPSNYRGVSHEFYFLASGSASYPEKKTVGFVKDYWPVVTSTGKPKYYTDANNDSWLLAPTPDLAYVFTVTYTKQVDHLSAVQQTNFLTSQCPAALFYGTMAVMSEFMKDYSVREIWESRYQEEIMTLNNEARRERRDGNAVPSNPTGGQNTINGGV